MPRTYARNHRARGSLPMGAVNTAQRQSANPYRMHRPDPLVNGVSNLAAALFRAPIERAQIEDQRKSADEAKKVNEQATAYAHSRDDKNDLFREKQLAQTHADAQAKIAASAGKGVGGGKAAGGKGSGDAHMGTIPAMVHQSTIDPKTHKTTYSQRPLNDDEMTGVMRNRDRLKATQDLGRGDNPSNGQPLGPGNPYEIKKPAEMAAADDLFARQHAPKPAAPSPAAGLFGPPAPAGGGAAAPAAAQDPHAVDPSLPPALAPQIAAISQAVAKLHPDDQQAYGQIMAGVAAAHKAGDPNAIAAATQKLQIANSRLLGQPSAPVQAPRGLGVQPGMGPPAPAAAPAAIDPFAGSNGIYDPATMGR